MGKKIKHKEDLRVVILEAAKKLFVQDGFDATSIRKIANEIGISPTTIYLYYKDKNDIIYALHQVGFNMLRDLFIPLMSVEDPFERLKALGRNYINFAFSHTEYYEVMFMMKEPMTFLSEHCESDLWEEGERVLDLLTHTVIACQEVGYFKDMSPAVVTMQVWSSVHGIVTLYVTQHLNKIMHVLEKEEGKEMELVNDCFKVFIKMIENFK